MKNIVIAAGYATRLGELTRNFPKPLLKIGENTILGRMLDDIDRIPEIDEHIVITNHKFAPIFEEWAAKKHSFSIVDDGTSSNETRLGAVKDIQFAIEQLHLDDDLLVMAGDNLLDFSLAAFIRYAQQKNATCVMRYYEADETKLRRSGVAEVAADDRILSMEEKPAQPKSHWCMPAFYYYTRHDSRLIQQAIDAGCGTDAPGSFISWLCTQTNVYAWEMPGKRYDIGNLASYEEVKKVFKGVTK